MDLASESRNLCESTFAYVQILADGRKFVVAKDLLETVTNEIGWESVEVLQELAGDQLEK